MKFYEANRVRLRKSARLDNARLYCLIRNDKVGAGELLVIAFSAIILGRGDYAAVPHVLQYGYDKKIIGAFSLRFSNHSFPPKYKKN